jgi:hypothetical protein
MPEGTEPPASTGEGDQGEDGESATGDGDDGDGGGVAIGVAFGAVIAKQNSGRSSPVQ